MGEKKGENKFTSKPARHIIKKRRKFLGRSPGYKSEGGREKDWDYCEFLKRPRLLKFRPNKSRDKLNGKPNDGGGRGLGLKKVILDISVA